MPFDVVEWLSSPAVAALTPAERGAYFDLRCFAWVDPECSLPADDDSLAMLSRLGEQWHCSAGRLRAQFIEREGRLYDLDLAETRKGALAKQAGNRVGGKKRAQLLFTSAGTEAQPE